MATPINICSASGAAFNTTVELTPTGKVFHSRSGTDRNRDYRPALELLMGRLDKAQIPYEIYLDSNRFQDIPLERRRLAFNRQAPISTRFIWMNLDVGI